MDSPPGPSFADVAREAVAIIGSDLDKFDFTSPGPPYRRFDPEPDPRLDGLARRLTEDWKDRESLRGLPDDLELKLFVRVLPAGGARFGVAGLGELLMAAAVVGARPCERHRKRMTAALVLSRLVGHGHGWLVRAVDGLAWYYQLKEGSYGRDWVAELECQTADKRDCGWYIGVGEAMRLGTMDPAGPAAIARRALNLAWEPQGSPAGMLGYEKTGGPWAHVRQAGLGGEGTDSTEGDYRELQCVREYRNGTCHNSEEAMRTQPWVLWDIPFPNCLASGDWPPGFKVYRCEDRKCKAAQKQAVVCVVCVGFSPTLRAWGKRMREMGPAGAVRLGYPLQAVTNDKSRFPFCGEIFDFDNAPDDIDTNDEKYYPLPSPCGGEFDCANGMVCKCNFYTAEFPIDEDSDDNFLGHENFAQSVKRSPSPGPF